MIMTETSGSATQHKHACEGAQRDKGKKNIEGIILQIQCVGYFSYFNDYKGQQGLARQSEGT
jgi:hypothetical protein